MARSHAPQSLHMARPDHARNPARSPAMGHRAPAMAPHLQGTAGSGAHIQGAGLQVMDAEQQPDTKPGFYYVSAIEDSRRGYHLLRGPFKDDHAGALAAVDDARRITCDGYPRAHWWSFGTVRCDDDRGPGILDRMEAATA